MFSVATCASNYDLCVTKSAMINVFVPGLGSIPELELTSIPIPELELELELQAMELELELELQDGIDWNWNGIEDFISIPPIIAVILCHFCKVELPILTVC